MLEIPPQDNITRRSAATNREYHEFLRSWDPSKCVFCDRQQITVVSTSYMRILKNEFPYEVMESARVIDHLMIVPVRHILRLEDFDRAERDDFFAFLSHYENDGYNVLERAQQNLRRSVAHNHTHLLKLDYTA